MTHNNDQTNYNNLCHKLVTTDLSGFGSKPQRIKAPDKSPKTNGMTTKVPTNSETNPTRKGNRAPPDDPKAVIMVIDITCILLGRTRTAIVTING